MLNGPFLRNLELEIEIVDYSFLGDWSSDIKIQEVCIEQILSVTTVRKEAIEILIWKETKIKHACRKGRGRIHWLPMPSFNPFLRHICFLKYAFFISVTSSSVFPKLIQGVDGIKIVLTNILY